MGRILVVDDEELVREAIKMRLERDGHLVDTAANELEALEKIRNAKQPYDVVINKHGMDSDNSLGEFLKSAQ